MKLYNPFRPHIYYDDGVYIVRVRKFLDWKYASVDGWWHAAHYAEICISEEDAKLLLTKRVIMDKKRKLEKKNRRKNRKVIVYNPKHDSKTV